MEKNIKIQLIAALLKSKIEKVNINLKIPEREIIDTVKNNPKWFHYRATRNGKILCWDITIEAIDEFLKIYPEFTKVVKENEIKENYKPFSNLSDPKSPSKKVWDNIKKQLNDQKIQYVDSSKKEFENIFGNKIDIDVLDSNYALDMLSKAQKMSEENSKQKKNKKLVIQQIKKILKCLLNKR